MTQETFGLTEMAMGSEEELTSFIAKFEESKQLRHKNIFHIEKASSQTEKALCGSFSKLQIVFQYSANTLAKDIAERQKTEAFFTEEELWFISESMISALAFFQVNNLEHKDICPSTIMISDRGIYRIGDYSPLTRGLSGYYRLLSGKTEDCYLSPTLLSGLSRKLMNPEHDSTKSDVYALGMTLLQAASLKDIRCCYDMSLFVVNRADMENLFAEVGARYSTGLEAFIRDLLNPDENERPDFNKIHFQMNNQTVYLKPVRHPSLS